MPPPKKAKWYQIVCSGCPEGEKPPECHYDPVLYLRECKKKLTIIEEQPTETLEI
jgi:hypothetical protein